jgi:hypothetical protein
MPFFTKPIEREEVDGEFEHVEAERIEIERLVKLNSEELANNPAPTAMGVRNASGTNVLRQRPSLRREQLLRTQQQLIRRRNDIYLRWSQLKGKALA